MSPCLAAFLLLAVNGSYFMVIQNDLVGRGVAAFDQFDGVAGGYYDNDADDDSTEFFWNVGVGGNYRLSDSITLYGEYQYASFGDVSTGQDSFTDGFKIDDVVGHEMAVGIRYSGKSLVGGPGNTVRAHSVNRIVAYRGPGGILYSA